MDCSRQYKLEAVRNPFLCECKGLLEVIHDFRSLDSERLKREFDRRLSERMTNYSSGVWRYKELILPELPDAYITTKFEGNTGMYDSDRVAKYAGIRKLMLKAQSENPSGSFKDNGMTVAVSHGRSAGYTRFTCTSTGNTSSSLAMYAAIAGCSSYVFLPNRNISMNKVLQTLAYGAHLLSFNGTYDDGIRFSETNSEILGLYVCNSINPFRIEGQKSIIFEIAHQLRWKLPDWIIVPGGALSHATALGKGLQDLLDLGFIDRLPKVAVIQAEGANPFHRMVAQGESKLTPELQPFTRASAMNIGNPPSWKKALHYTVRQTNGVTASVTDEEIMNAKAVIDQSGIGCEPASAASVAGLKKLVEEGVVDREATAVCLLTGNMLKDTDAIREYHLDSMSEGIFANKIIPVSLDFESLQGYVPNL
ncbi:threonine synthase [Paenibacillus sp. LMG 31456]|uniref:Threonine synthase n=2 Tax=Paenibacillus foliorum TaxID=2654974 RepID=A0A972H0J0_9BACL|nr:threonine synthase [Paenibacillus foliorum]NOU97994.1 threonine synthase [Paenibacillus foliorum]